MQQPPPLFLLSAMQKPLRDAMRGVATFAEMTEEALEPAANMLPDPVRSTVRSALDALEEAGTKFINSSIAFEDILVASDVLMGKESGAQAQERCASVIAFAWERLWQAGKHQHHLMISETILAARLASKSPVSGETPGQRAAQLLSSIRQSSAIGRAPGMPGRHTAEDQEVIDLALVSTMVWLLAARAVNLDEEERLLDLSSALSLAMKADIFAAIDDPEHVARLLPTLAAHL